jgi:DNA mismatch repair protein MutL
MSRRPVVQLPTKVANQIAAGEVVARPASVVKELLENALDAGAKRIGVHIEGGGAERIVVVDDGHGMNEQDARQSLLRHATSKIRDVADLTSIETFGFRGEALPSIASVSKLRMRTRELDADEGIELWVDGGAAPVVRPCGTAPGTSIEVAELFFNVPARRKFLRATSTEAAHVTDAVRQVALARPDVRIELTRDGRANKEWLSAPTRAERVAAVLGLPDLTACLGEHGPMRIEGYLSSPDKARSGAGGLHLFVCGRPVRDRALARAVATAYGDLLEPGRYPVGAVFVTMPLDLVDVNVHPQKAEVRFAHARAVTSALYRVVVNAIGVAPTRVPEHAPIVPARHWKRPEADHERWTFRVSEEPPSQRASAGPVPESRVPSGASSGNGIPRAPLPETPWTATHSPTAARDRTAHRAPTDPKQPSLRFVAEVGPGLAIFEDDTGLTIVDLERARRELLRIDARRAWLGGGLSSQRLLFPVARETSAKVAERAEQEAGEAARLGFDLRRAGEHTVAVHAVPRLFAAAAPEAIVEALILILSDGLALDEDALDELVPRACAHPEREHDLVARLASAPDAIAAACPRRLGFAELASS